MVVHSNPVRLQNGCRGVSICHRSQHVLHAISARSGGGGVLDRRTLCLESRHELPCQRPTDESCPILKPPHSARPGDEPRVADFELCNNVLRSNVKGVSLVGVCSASQVRAPLQ